MHKILYLIILFLPLTSVAQWQWHSIYFNDFESKQSFSVPSNSEFERGVPSATHIKKAYSGQNVWATDLDSIYNTSTSTSYLITPYIPAKTPFYKYFRISFRNRINMDTAKSLNNSPLTHCYIEYQIDQDTNYWSRLNIKYFDTLYSKNWYNSSYNSHPVWSYFNAGWFLSELCMQTAVNGCSSDSIRFRFVFVNQGNNSMQEDGWAIDDFNFLGIKDGHNLNLKLISPQGNPQGNPDSIHVRIYNLGVKKDKPTIMGYEIDNIGLLVTDNYNKGYIYPGDSADFTFHTPYVPGVGVYNLRVYMTTMIGDFKQDDTVNTQIIGTGIINSEQNPIIHCYPNPTGDYIYISTIHCNNEKTTYKIIDNNGSIVKTGGILLSPNQNSIINVNNIANGIYYLYLENPSWKKQVKLIIKH